MRRRHFLPLLAALPASLARTGAAETAIPITMHKSPSCTCCARWGEYLEGQGFAVTEIGHADMGPIKLEHGVPPGLQSCHTALVDGYVIEGHVPADDIRRLLRERPAVAGLSAPGMPQMSPGMMSEQPQGYDVVSFGPDGRIELYSRY